MPPILPGILDPGVLPGSLPGIVSFCTKAVSPLLCMIPDEGGAMFCVALAGTLLGMYYGHFYWDGYKTQLYVLSSTSITQGHCFKSLSVLCLRRYS